MGEVWYCPCGGILQNRGNEIRKGIEGMRTREQSRLAVKLAAKTRLQMRRISFFLQLFHTVQHRPCRSKAKRS